MYRGYDDDDDLLASVDDLGPDPLYSGPDSYELEFRSNDLPKFGYNLRNLITNAEQLIIEYIQKDQEITAMVALGINYRDIASSSGTYYYEHDDELFQPANNLLEPEDDLLEPEDDLLEAEDDLLEPIDDILEPDDEILEPDNDMYTFIRRIRYHNITNAKITTGSWLILMNTDSGWNYNRTENYFLRKFGLLCERSQINRRYEVNNEFKAVIQVDSIAKLNRVIVRLQKSNTLHNFAFLSVVKRLTEEGDTDSDSESRAEYLAQLNSDSPFDFTR